MKTMQPILQQFLILSGTAILLAATDVPVHMSRACNSVDTTTNCSQHSLQCQQGSIFITEAVRWFQSVSSGCTLRNIFCWFLFFINCCPDKGHFCHELYSQEAFSALSRECWNKQSCNYSVPSEKGTNCVDDYEQHLIYSEVQYLCLQDLVTMNFSDTSSNTGKSLVLRYDSSHDEGKYVCRVVANDCIHRPVEVVLYRSKPLSNDEHCTSFEMTEGFQFPCDASWTLNATYTGSTPLELGLSVEKNNDVAQAWALIYDNSSGTLRVTCRNVQTETNFPPCFSATTPSAFSETTTLLTEGLTSGSSAATDASRAENSSTTAGIIGGVVGAVLVVVLVAVLATVIFVKRRSSQGKAVPKVVAWFKGGNSSNRNSPAAGSSDPGRSQPHVTPSQATSLPVYDNSAAAITDEAGVRVDPDSDYNHLGQKPTSSASRDVTYGHLADVTDHDYDHVAKGKPAVRSGDVINNIYNTAGPATGGSSDEDFYNTTVGAKNRPDVINNVYNTPGPATGASPDVECNIAGIPQTGRDVINNDYDIPKSARTPGPGENEAHDVTGDDAGFQYELARNVK